MSNLQTRPVFDTTSAAGAMLVRQVQRLAPVGFMLFTIGATSADGLPLDAVLRSQRTADQTTTGASVPTAAPVGAAIGELRRLSGLTWDQLARLFNVSRRSLHFWASGKPIAPSNEEHLQRLLVVLRKIDRGSASANRSMLLGAREDGTLPFDLLTNGDYERVLLLAGVGNALRVSPRKLSAEAEAARAPPPPENLVGALQDRIHRDSGTARAAKSVRVRGGRRA
jgi:DNA-binding transcriptional regulator YiaG